MGDGTEEDGELGSLSRKAKEEEEEGRRTNGLIWVVCEQRSEFRGVLQGEKTMKNKVSD